MLKKMHIEAEAAGLLGDLGPLVSRLGSPDACGASEVSLGGCKMDSVPALQHFLREYQQRILAPLELPAILRAYQHATRNEVRELIEMDLHMAHEPMLKDFAAA